MGFLACLTGVFKPRFETNKVVQEITCPLLVIHGDQDTLIPLGHGQRITELAIKTERKLLSVRPGCTHLRYNRDKDIAVQVAEFMKTFNISTLMEAPPKKENETYVGLPDTVETESIFSQHLDLKLEH